MTFSELQTIKESIERIERFPIGYPRLIEDVDEKWRSFFQMEYEWCVERKKQLYTPSETVPLTL